MSNRIPERKPGTKSLADRFTGERCTLDGKPATIKGRLNRFASVVTLNESVEFAWETVERVMTYYGGRFRS